MKIAVFGRGKTGSEVLRICSERKIDTLNFHRENPPNLEGLKECDAIISFIPAAAFNEYMDMLIAARKPIISGSTGMAWPSELDETLKKANMLWIQGHNFSLGMSIVHNMISALSKAQEIFEEEITSSIHEIHHTKKLDAPSGTAIRWNEWLGMGSVITSDRQGDVVGTHTLTLESASESITLTHKALDRGLFASGALWATNYALRNTQLTGFHWFEDLTHKELL